MGLDIDSGPSAIVSNRKSPALLPGGHLGALLQVHMLKELGQNFCNGYDRSGNALAFETKNPNTAPSDIPGRACWDNALIKSYFSCVSSDALRLRGEMTFIGKIAAPGYKSEGNESYIIHCGDWTSGNPSGACLFSLGVGVPTPAGSALFYYCEWDAGGGNKGGGSWATPIISHMNDGTFKWVALRRNAAGTQVTMNCDGEQWTSPDTLHPPTAGGGAIVHLGGTNLGGSSAQHFLGQVEDFNLWNRRLTDAEMADCRRRMMGL